jgi:hypothetical protein
MSHAISLDNSRLDNLVVGLGRTSAKWSGRRLINQVGDSDKRIFLPLSHLAHICRVAKTRYGYIQTDEELVVCCFSNDGDVNWSVAMESIPWSQHGVGLLTADLALWWLCMIAMATGNDRAITRVEAIPKINEWHTEYAEGRGWLRRHRYSGLELPTDDSLGAPSKDS